MQGVSLRSAQQFFTAQGAREFGAELIGCAILHGHDLVPALYAIAQAKAASSDGSGLDEALSDERADFKTTTHEKRQIRIQDGPQTEGLEDEHAEQTTTVTSQRIVRDSGRRT